MKYVVTLMMSVLAVACSGADFSADSAPKRPAATSNPVQPSEPIPQDSPSNPGIQPQPQQPQTIPMPTPPRNSNPNFWDGLKTFFNGLDFDNSIDFGDGLKSFHIGNGEFSGSSECAFRMSFRPLKGRMFKFQFNVTQPNTNVRILIDKVCGVDRTNNYVQFFNNGYEVQQYRANLAPRATEYEFPSMLLQPGSYEVVVVSPDYDLNGRNDPDDFVVGKVRIRADKQVNKGQVIAQ